MLSKSEYTSDDQYTFMTHTLAHSLMTWPCLFEESVKMDNLAYSNLLVFKNIFTLSGPSYTWESVVFTA